MISITNKWLNIHLRKEVTYEQGQKFAKRNGMIFMETSAKTGFNVDSVNILLF